jgi:hypothetical protein
VEASRLTIMKNQTDSIKSSYVLLLIMDAIGIRLISKNSTDIELVVLSCIYILGLTGIFIIASFPQINPLNQVFSSRSEVEAKGYVPSQVCLPGLLPKSKSESEQDDWLNEGPFVGSKKSNKYHKFSCHFASQFNPEKRRVFKTRKDVINAGYVTCKVCNP